jgi:hypothetical protein
MISLVGLRLRALRRGYHIAEGTLVADQIIAWRSPWVEFRLLKSIPDL